MHFFFFFFSSFFRCERASPTYPLREVDRWKKLRDQIAVLEQGLVSDRELGDTRIRKRSFVSIFTRTIDFGIDLDRFVILLTILKRPPIEPSAKICGYVQWHISKDGFKLLIAITYDHWRQEMR